MILMRLHRHERGGQKQREENAEQTNQTREVDEGGLFIKVLAVFEIFDQKKGYRQYDGRAVREDRPSY